MGQRNKELTRIWGYYGWRVTRVFYEGPGGTRMQPVAGYDVPQEVRLVLRVERRWSARCGECHAICTKVHQQLKPRR